MTEHGQVVDGEDETRPAHRRNGETRSVEDIQGDQLLPRIGCNPHPRRHAAEGFLDGRRQS